MYLWCSCSRKWYWHVYTIPLYFTTLYQYTTACPQLWCYSYVHQMTCYQWHNIIWHQLSNSIMYTWIYLTRNNFNAIYQLDQHFCRICNIHSLTLFSNPLIDLLQYFTITLQAWSIGESTQITDKYLGHSSNW